MVSETGLGSFEATDSTPCAAVNADSASGAWLAGDGGLIEVMGEIRIMPVRWSARVIGRTELPVYLGSVDVSQRAALLRQIAPGKTRDAGKGCSLAKSRNAAWHNLTRNPQGRACFCARLRFLSPTKPRSCVTHMDVGNAASPPGAGAALAPRKNRLRRGRDETSTDPRQPCGARDTSVFRRPNRPRRYHRQQKEPGH